MLLTWITASLAGGPADTLNEAMAADAYAMGLVCSPSGALYDVGLMAGQVLEAAGQVWRPEVLAQVQGWFAPESASLFSRDGVLYILSNQGDGGAEDLRVPFSGTEQDLVALAAGAPWLKLAPGPDGHLVGDGQTVLVQDAALRIRVAGTGTSRLPPGMLAGLGGDVGCAVAVDLSVMPGREAPVSAVSAYLPLGTEELYLMRLQLEVPVDGASAAPVRVGFSGSSSLPPDLVVLAADSGDDALALLGALSQDPRSARFFGLVTALGDPVGLPAGTTVAVFGQGSSRRAVAVVPALSPKGKPIKTRKAMSAVQDTLETGDGSWERQGDDGFRVVQADGYEVWIRISEGQLVIGDQPEVVAEAHVGAGEPWGSPEAAAMTAEWPYVFVPGRLPRLPTALPLAVGVRFEDGLLELGVDTLGERGNDYLVGMLVGMAVPNFVQMRQRARRTELQTELAMVVTAQLGHSAAYGGYLEVPAAPRAPEALTHDAVPWAAVPAWEPLGLSPEGDVRGTYSVALTELGAVAHGWMDADGDGVPAHMIVTLTPAGPSPPELLTPDDVY